MNRRQYVHIGIFVAIFIGMVTMEYTAPKPADWKISFERNKKSPYGSYTIYELLKKSQNKPVRINQESFFEGLNQESDARKQNLLIIDFDFSPDELDQTILMDFVGQGNTAFISAEHWGQAFQDSLNFNTEDLWLYYMMDDSICHMNFDTPTLKSDSNYIFSKDSYYTYFSNTNNKQTRLIGSMQDTFPNFIKINYGSGHFLLHSYPKAFTNYSLLNENKANYVFRALSYLEDRPLIWDEYYKPNKVQQSTPLRYILSTKSLKAAYYIGIFGIVWYILFGGKRRQRIIPVIMPPKNSSKEFVETNGRLYLYEKNHRNLALKKFEYFQHFLREKYYLDTKQESQPDKIAEKTGTAVSLVNELFKYANRIYESDRINASELLKFTELIEKFYQHAA